MIRYLRAIACTLLILASVALTTLWVRSFETADQLRGRLWGQQSFVIASKQGRTTAVAFRWTRAPGYLWRLEVARFPAKDEYTFPWNPAWVRESKLGFGWNGEPNSLRQSTLASDNTVDPKLRLAERVSIPGLHGAGPIMPFWFLVLVTAALAGFAGTNWPLRCSIRGLFVAVTIVAIVSTLEAHLGR